MGYYTDFDLDKKSQLKLPLDFLQFVNFETDDINRINYLESLSEDIMTVKELKELQSLKIKSFEPKRITNKYGYDILYFRDTRDIKSIIEENNPKLFLSIDDEILTLAEEGSYITFQKTDTCFQCVDLGYTQSNYGWVQEKVENLIQTFKLSLTILDMGDEEYGFEGQDGCKRPLEDKVYINGKLQ